MVTGMRKVIILLPSNGAKKPIPGILCMMADWTVSLEMMQMQFRTWRMDKAIEKWNKDTVGSNKQPNALIWFRINTY